MVYLKDMSSSDFSSFLVCYQCGLMKAKTNKIQDNSDEIVISLLYKDGNWGSVCVCVCVYPQCASLLWLHPQDPVLSLLQDATPWVSVNKSFLTQIEHTHTHTNVYNFVICIYFNITEYAFAYCIRYNLHIQHQIFTVKLTGPEQ